MESENIIDMVKTLQHLCNCILMEIDPETRENIKRLETCRSIIHGIGDDSGVETVITSTNNVKKKGGRAIARPYTGFAITKSAYKIEDLAVLWKVSVSTARKNVKKLAPGVKTTVFNHQVYYPAKSVHKINELFDRYYDSLESNVPGKKKRYNIDMQSPIKGDVIRNSSEYTREYEIAEENRKLEETEGPEYWPDPTPECFKEI